MIYSDGWFCDDCNGPSAIRGNRYVPSYFKYLHLKSERKLYYGIELEVEVPGSTKITDVTEEIQSRWNDKYIYFKHDGSIEYGFEMVTLPMTWEFLQNEKLKIFSTLGGISSFNCKSFNTNTCGIHIHVSKQELSHLTIYKILKLFYENPNFILKVSQRKESQFTQWASLNSEGSEGKLYMKAKNKTGCNRYVAVNLNNYDTVEFRIFRGTLSPKSFFKNLEFVKATIDFAEATGIPNITISKFILFVESKKKEFPNLNEFLTARRLGTGGAVCA